MDTFTTLDFFLLSLISMDRGNRCILNYGLSSLQASSQVGGYTSRSISQSQYEREPQHEALSTGHHHPFRGTNHRHYSDTRFHPMNPNSQRKEYQKTSHKLLNRVPH
jgi:hypothetical protein